MNLFQVYVYTSIFLSKNDYLSQELISNPLITYDTIDICIVNMKSF